MMALFDSNIVNNKIQRDIITKSINLNNYSFSYMPNINGNMGEKQIDIAVEMGCKAIVFHPYLQCINHDKIERVRQLSIYAAEKGVFICICSAYGSKDIYKYKPLEVVVAVAESVDCPVVIVHGGGAKVLDAFLIAESFPNIYLDTSFSLHYWQGSPVEEAYAFSIKRLGADRWVFGSDAPFRTLDKTIKIHIDFFNKYGFTKKETSQILSGTAERLLGL
jgi:predicted TIM-barrel fold metal-dependent hydrolase